MQTINGERIPDVGNFSRIRALLRAAIIEAEWGVEREQSVGRPCEQTIEEFTTVERELHGVLVRLS